MKQIEVKLFGLNELGVKELNEHYKHNIERYQSWNEFRLGQTLGLNKKRFKQVKSFYKHGLDNYVGSHDCTQLRLNEDGTDSKYSGPYFSYQIKHFVHEIYEVNIVETFTKVNI